MERPPPAASPPLSSSAMDQNANAEAKALALQHAQEVAMKAELKRLREEHLRYVDLQAKYRALEQEVEYLRRASLLQHEEKVPIRLRQLEQENMRLRHINASLTERIKQLETDEYSTLLTNHYKLLSTRNMESSARSPTADDDENPLSPTKADRIIAGDKAVVVIRGGTGPCVNCSLKLSIAQNAFDAEKAQLKRRISELEATCKTATDELDAIKRWVDHVVQVHSRYPTLAQTLPTTSIIAPSPTREMGYLGSTVTSPPPPLYAALDSPYSITANNNNSTPRRWASR